MKFFEINPPRLFKAGKDSPIILKDCAHINLENDEQVTFKTKMKSEYDIVKKEWGFYATPSLNGRLEKFGFKPVLVRSINGKYHVLLVERGKEACFYKYIENEKYSIICWMNDEKILKKLKR